MIYNTVFIPYHYTNNILLKLLGIHCSLIKIHDFFVFLQNKGIFVATLDVKKRG